MSSFVEILASIPVILLFSFLGLRQTQLLTTVFKRFKNLKTIQPKPTSSLKNEELEKIIHGNYTCYKEEF